MIFIQFSNLFLVILIQFNLNYGPTVCDLLDDNLLSQTDDFWQWIWGQDENETEHKPEEHIKEELEYHYGKEFFDLHGIDDLRLELDFHIFNLHDFDKNQLLDGLEMLSMLDRHNPGQHTYHHKTHSLERNTAVIDLVLRTDDKNGDGFLDYNEFKSAKIKHNLKVL